MHPHPYAEMFPRMNDKDCKALTASIREHGLEEPIVTYEGKILDGRNRSAACTNAQVKPRYTKYTGKDPLGYVVRKNLVRRHLTTSQRTMVASKMADLVAGSNQHSLKKTKENEVGPKDPTSGEPSTIKQAATALKVSPRSVKRGNAVLASGDEKLIKDVEDGKMTVGAAEKAVKVKQNPEQTPAKKKPTPSKAEQEGNRLLKLWDNTGPAGRKWFLDGIGVD